MYVWAIWERDHYARNLQKYPHAGTTSTKNSTPITTNTTISTAWQDTTSIPSSTARRNGVTTHSSLKNAITAINLDASAARYPTDGAVSTSLASHPDVPQILSHRRVVMAGTSHNTDNNAMIRISIIMMDVIWTVGSRTDGYARTIYSATDHRSTSQLTVAMVSWILS